MNLWFAENDKSFVVGAGDKELAHVGTTVRSGTNQAHKESKQLARLFAAAPELLEACKEAAKNCIGCGGVGITSNALYLKNDCRFCKQLRDAIAKAEGR